MSNPLTKFDDSKDLIVFGDLPELLKPMQEKIYLDSVYAAGISHLDDPELPAKLNQKKSFICSENLKIHTTSMRFELIMKPEKRLDISQKGVIEFLPV